MPDPTPTDIETLLRVMCPGIPAALLPNYVSGVWDLPIGRDAFIRLLAYLRTREEEARREMRERAVELSRSVRNTLAANASACICGNGRIPVTAHAEACGAYAAAIAALPVEAPDQVLGGEE